MADRLGRFIYEVEEITIDEMNEWVAYFKIDEERQRRGNKKM